MEDKSNKPMITDEFMEWEERDESVPFLKHCIAGSCAGIMEHMGLYPIDTLKVSFSPILSNLIDFFIFSDTLISFRTRNGFHAYSKNPI